MSVCMCRHVDLSVWRVCAYLRVYADMLTCQSGVHVCISECVCRHDTCQCGMYMCMSEFVCRHVNLSVWHVCVCSSVCVDMALVSVACICVCPSLCADMLTCQCAVYVYVWVCVQTCRLVSVAWMCMFECVCRHGTCQCCTCVLLVGVDNEALVNSVRLQRPLSRSDVCQFGDTVTVRIYTTRTANCGKVHIPCRQPQ